MPMLRTTAIWTGFPGAPGYTNHYWNSQGGLDAAAAANAVQRMRDFFGAITLSLPAGVSIAVQPTVAVVETGDGSQSGEFLAATPTVVAGAGANTYAGPAGACVTWRSSAFVEGKRLRGRTFIVPLTSAAFEADGTIIASRLADLRAAATTLATPGSNAAFLAVWKRPTPGAGGGISASVSAATVNDRVAILKSRR